MQTLVSHSIAVKISKLYPNNLGKLLSVCLLTLFILKSAEGIAANSIGAVLLNQSGPFNISGVILDDNGTALSGVTMTLSGETSAVSTTTTDGSYSFGNLAAGGNYTITPAKVNYSFLPQNQSFSNLSANVTADFIGALLTFKVSGLVTDSRGVGLGGASIVLSGIRNYVVTSASDGSYSISELPLGANYTVTANLPGYAFTPPVRTFTNVAGNRIANFSAAPAAYNISGMVRATGSSSGVSGVPILLSGTRSAMTLSGTDGSYAFTSLPSDGNYTVSVSYGTSNFRPFLLDAPVSHSFDRLPTHLRLDFTVTPLINTFERLLTNLDVGDFNRDGKPDVVAASLSGFIHVLNGRGDGTFERGASYDLANGSSLVSTADINGDGNPDVILGNGGINGVGHTLTVLLGNGDGTLRTMPAIPLNAGVQSIATGDFNADRHVDIATTSYSGSPAGSISKLIVFFGNGDGTFRSAVDYEVGFYPRTVISADLNGDDKLDLAITLSSTRDNVKIFLNRGDGTFSASANYTGDTSSGALAAGDFNADGKTDLAVGTGILNANTVRVFPGNGDGTFQSSTAYDAGAPPQSIKVGDLNGDNKLDLIVLNDLKGVSTLQGRGDGTFMSAVNYDHSSDPYISTFGLALADFNNDAKLDFLISGYNQRPGDFGAGYIGTMLNSPALPTQGQTYSIKGQLRDSEGKPLVGVPVIFGGKQSGSTVTDANGNYSLTNIISGAEISVTPVKPFYSFNPQTRVVISDSNKSGVDFTGDRERFKVSGQIKERGNALANTVVTLNSAATGAFHATTLTDGEGKYSFANMLAGEIYTITPARLGYSFNPSKQGVLLTSNRSDLNFTAYSPPVGVQFSMANYSVGEGDGRAVITITRTGNTSGVTSVTYTTVDNPAAVRCDDSTTMPSTAFARCDYATSIDTVSFAAGEVEKSFTIPIIDDAHPESSETVQVRLFNPTSLAIGSQSTASLSISDNDTGSVSNPIDDTAFFVRMQYLDFLSREPEAGEPWSGVLNRCPDVNADQACDRNLVSQSFFGSPEFRLKGFYVFNFYRVAFNRRPTYEEIIPDMRNVSGASEQEVYQKRAAFPVSFAGRPEFKGLYEALNDMAFVNTLLDRYGLQQITSADPANPEDGAKVVLTRADLINRLGASGAQSLTRAQVLRALVESNEVGAAEYNRAFVAMQYYGYLRRTPEEDGYQAWLRVINQDPNNIRLMVNGFMNSTEYKLRFGRAQ